MKLGVLFFAAALAQAVDYDEDYERGKKDKVPTKRPETRPTKKPVTKPTKKPVTKPTKKPTKPCMSLHPSTCKDCEKLGQMCIEQNGVEKVCEKLLWDGKKCQKDDDKPICPEIDVRTCEQCKQLGPKCVVSTGAKKQCELLHYNVKKNECSVACIKMVPTDCAGCMRLGRDCVRSGGHVDKCKIFKFDFKKETCPVKPDCKGHEKVEDCEDCKEMGKACIIEGDFQKQCKALGFNPKKGTCKPPKPTKPTCPMVEPDTCADCLKISRDCLMATGKFKMCVKVLGMGKDFTCPDKCPTITKCTDCIELERHCVKPTAKVCKSFGFKKGRCPTPMPDCDMPNNCVDCLKKPASKDKKCQKTFKKKCGQMKCEGPREGDGFFV